MKAAYSYSRPEAQTAEVPATETQRDLWLACQQNPALATACVDCISLKFATRVDAGLLQQALNRLEDAHPALRCVFSPHGASLLLQAPAHRKLRLSVISGDGDSARALREAEAATALPLDGSPLWRAHLLSCFNAAELLLSFHSALIDAYSRERLAEHLQAIYHALAAGRQPASAATDQFDAMYALMQQDQSDRRHDAHAYWLEHFRHGVPATPLPTDFPRQGPLAPDSAVSSLQLPASLSEKLLQAGHKRGIGIGDWLLAAYAVFLYQLSGERHRVIGLPVCGQDANALPRALGQFSKLLPLSLHVDENMAFSRCLSRISLAAQMARRHRHVSLHTLHKALPPGQAARPDGALYATVFDYCPSAAPQATEGLPAQADFNEWRVQIRPAGDTLQLDWHYRRSLFAESRMQQRAAQFVQLLEELADYPEQTLTHLRQDSSAQ
ncbi:condensation domain-containing protein [Granulosicoccaceae sp. 1_MG-2023]|nr:condensation domain-containing protein [Granulosicoccaceae sp. 1_MG-2023]